MHGVPGGSDGDRPPLAAVVGGGIGGSAAAYFLRQKFGPGVQLHVLEKAALGGRLHTLDLEGAAYEAGGSVIHPLNLHMKHFVKELGEHGHHPGVCRSQNCASVPKLCRWGALGAALLGDIPQKNKAW